MKIYKKQADVKKDIKDGVLAIKGDVNFQCSISINASIVITGGNIKARNIKARNLTALNITAGNLTIWNLTALNITVCNLTALNITAWNINARNIDYFAFCCVYNSITCTLINGRRKPHHEPICLSGKLIIKEKHSPFCSSQSGDAKDCHICNPKHPALIIDHVNKPEPSCEHEPERYKNGDIIELSSNTRHCIKCDAYFEKLLGKKWISKSLSV